MSQFNPSPHHPKSPVDDVWREEKGALDKDREPADAVGAARKVENQEMQGLGDAQLRDKLVQHPNVAQHPHQPPHIMNRKTPQ